VLLKAALIPARFDIPISLGDGAQLIDVLNSGEAFRVDHNHLQVDPVHPNWARILKTNQ
jgi:hypothetical protein